MKKIDLYIIRKFLTTFFFIMGVIMVVAIIFDVSEKIDDFVENKAPLKAILYEYYLNFAINYGNLFSPLLIFISVIFFTSKMASDTEIVAILSSGTSFKRILFPYFIAATILASMSYWLNHWMTPSANKTRLSFEETYIRNPYRNWNKNIHKQIEPGTFIYFESYNNIHNVGRKFSLEKWENNELKYKLMSDHIKFDTVSGKWSVSNYYIREISEMKEKIHKGKNLDTVFAFQPEDFAMRMNNTETMKTDELKAFIKKETEEGSEDIPFYEIELYQRTSLPFSTYILTLIGVSVASRKVRGGIGLHIAIGLLICVSYILTMKVTTVYATNAGLDPFMAVWLPNLLFGLFSLFLFHKAPK